MDLEGKANESSLNMPVDATGAVFHECLETGVNHNVLLRGPLVQVPFPEGVTELGAGVFTVVEGEDNQAAPIDRNLPRLSDFGKPVRIARTDTDLFATLSTPAARAWLDRDSSATMASDGAFMAVIDELDAHDVFVAHVSQARDPLEDLRESRDRSRDQQIQLRTEATLIEQPCDYVGVGAAANQHGDITTYVVYSFPSRDLASEALPSVAASWGPDGKKHHGALVQARIEKVLNIAQRDNLVVVTLDAGELGVWIAQSAGKHAPVACWQDR